MVCRECGAYNAEHLTHCRVCAAKLRDTDAAAQPADVQEPQQEMRPQRGFVAAPSWPTRAFSGAAEQPAAYAPPAGTTSSAPAPAPQQPAATAVAQPASSAAYAPLGYAARTAAPAKPAAVCPRCGKPALPDAPFCPYCGTSLAAAPAEPLIQPTYTQAAAPVTPAQKPVKPAVPVKPAKRAADLDDDFDDDYDDEDDDFDDAPKKKRGKALSRKEKKKAKKSRFEDDFDDEDEDIPDDEDYDEDDYDDDFDDEDDDMPKRRGKSASFLLWGLIILLVALIAVFGIYVVNKNFGGDAGALFSSISSAFGKNKEPAEEAPAEGDAAIDAPVATESNMYTATVTETTNESGVPSYNIAVFAPTGSTLRIITNAELDSNSVTVPANDQVVLSIERDVFLPNAPCDNAVVTVTPHIEVDTPTGETRQITVPEITLTVPELTLNLDAPSTETVQQTFNNDSIMISGTVEDHTVEVYVNGQQLTVYDGGMFTTSYTPLRPVSTSAPAAATAATAATDTTAAAGTADAAADTAAADDTAAATDADTAATADAADTTATDAASTAADTAPAAATAAATGSANYQTDDQGREIIVIEARKNNYVTARKVITIEPFVMQNISLVVNNAAASNPTEDQLYNAEGAITLTGSITPGSTLRASISDDADVTIGEPTIDGGAFTLAVKLNSVGVHKIDLTATQEGYYETSTTVTVQRPPSDAHSKYLKACKKLVDSYADIIAGTTISGDFQATGRITEIVSSSPYTVYKLAIDDEHTVVCVHRSAKSTINSGDLKEKKQVMGSLVGTYSDGTTEYPYLYVWYSLNK